MNIKHIGSIWENDLSKNSFECLKDNKHTDVLIVGGGITGILCAYKLKKAGVDCLLVEAKNICNGITKNTTAKITISHGLIYDKLIRRFGIDKAKLYLDVQTKALNEYERICKNLDCDYETRDSYAYSLDDKIVIKKEIISLNRLGIQADFSQAHELPFAVAGAVHVKNQAQFSPVRFIKSIAKDLPIYENTKVIEFMPNKVITNNGEITYKKLIIATHFPIINKHGLFSLKLYQHRSYVVALKGAQNINGMYVDEKDTGLSFRSYGDMLLLGGGGHRTGKEGGGWHELEDFVHKYYPDAQIISKWATQDCMTLDGVPYIGQYSKSTPNIYTATGFNKWGITNAMVASDILCDIVQEKPNMYSKLFSPSRSMYSSQLAVNTFESLMGILTPTTPRCPHLGCALKYNKQEHSWDCPCHGSRFTEKGELIDNPATDDHKNLIDKS